MSGPAAVTLTVNGEAQALAIAPTQTLLQVLRDELGLTGAKAGCEQGVCGACTVLIDGAPALSCLALAANLGDASVTTIEGLAQGETLHPVQQAFVDAGAIQCGFCMTGMIMSAVALLNEHERPGRAQILHAIGGNLCRCSGYVKVIEAIELAASRITP
jgi:carbon-monoxide dehydrogenase small subunit